MEMVAAVQLLILRTDSSQRTAGIVYTSALMSLIPTILLIAGLPAQLVPAAFLIPLGMGVVAAIGGRILRPKTATTGPTN